MKLLMTICLSAYLLNSVAQDKNQFYALDAKMNQTVLDSSKYLLWIHEKDDGNWQWDYYHTWGPLIKSQSFTDHDGTILNGRSCFYNVMGNIDSLGIFDHGKKSGSFYKYTSITRDSVVALKQYDYVQDSLVKSANLLAERGKNKDSDTSGKESEYPGGIPEWNFFLLHNLVYPERAITKEIQGQVQIFFLVDKEGNIIDLYIQKSVEYSLDQESIRVIKKSGKWEPAFQDSVYRKSYKLMPINYKLEAH